MKNYKKVNTIKKKICIVSDTNWEQTQGGAEYQLYLLAHELVKRGYPAYYIFVDRNGRVSSNEVLYVPLKINNVVKRIFYPYKFLLWPSLTKALKEIQPDVIINRVADALTGICAIYAKKSNCKMIWNIANEPDVSPFQFKWKRTILCEYIDKKILNYGIKKSDYIIAQTNYQNRLLAENFGRQCDLLVPNFHPRPNLDGKKNNRKKIFWVANIKPHKQPECFIQLAEMFKDKRDIEFIMAGRPGKRKDQLRLTQLIQPLPNIHYMGELPLDRVNELLIEAFAFVNTSRYEGFPNTFIQAWMRKVSVLSLSVDPDDVIKEERIGFHSRSVNQMALDLDILLNNERLHQEMGERAQEYAFKAHDIQTNIDKIVNLIESC